MLGRGEQCEPDPASPAATPSRGRKGSRGVRQPDRPRSVVTRKFAALSDQPLTGKVSPIRKQSRKKRRSHSFPYTHPEESGEEDDVVSVAATSPSTETLDWAPDWDYPVYQESDFSDDSEVSVSEVFLEDRKDLDDPPTPSAPANSPEHLLASDSLRFPYHLRRQHSPAKLLKTSIRRVLDRKKRLSRSRRFREDWPPENPNRPVLPLTNTMVEIDKHKAAASLAVMKYDDEFEDFDLEVETSELRSTLVEATKAKTQLQEAMVYLMLHDNANYEANLKATMQTAKVGIFGLIKRIQACLKARAATEDTAAANTAGLLAQQAKLKADRVDRQCDSFCESMHKNSNVLFEMMWDENNPTTDQAFGLYQDKLNQYIKLSSDLIKDVQGLYKDASDTGLNNLAVRMDNGMIKLRGLIIRANEKLIALREQFQISSTGSDRSRSDLKPPTFSGNSHPDFFTFKTDFADYISTKSCSREASVRLLKHECLQKNPQKMVSHLDDLDEIWAVLKTTFGNPAILINQRLEEIKRLGKCAGSAENRREWTIDVHSKLTKLDILAKKHGKEGDLYHSGIVGEIKDLLPYRVLEDFKDLIFDLEEANGRDMSKPDIFGELVKFLKCHINKETSNMRFDLLTVGDPKPATPRPPSQPKPGDPQKNPQNRGGQKKAFVATTAALPPAPPPTASAPSSRRARNKKRAAAAAATTAAATPAAAATALVGHQNNQGAQRPGYCNDCNQNHEFLYYCKSFQSKDTEGRIKMASYFKTCFRCLRTDSQVNFMQRNKWWDDHKANCKTDFPCKVSVCGRREPQKQRHMLMCEYHEEDNKKGEKTFVDSLDKSLIPTNLRFFFLSPSCYNVEAHPSSFVEELVDGAKVVPDVTVPSIYMVHTIKGDDGLGLLAFYDSGCNNASISSRAYNLLDCRTVRPGPTYLNVAGGSAIKLEHGDEEFLLDLDGPDRKKALLTALRMDVVTDVFPLWPLQEAFDHLQAGYSHDHPEGEPLPLVDKEAGGQSVDLMIGIKYNRYFPKLMYMLPCGLGIYKAQLKTATGRQGVLGGPHASWRNAAKQSMFLNPQAYLTSECRAYQAHCRALDHRIRPISGILFDEDDPLEDDPEVLFAEAAISVPHAADMSNLAAKSGCHRVHCSKHQASADWRIPSTWDTDPEVYTAMQDELKYWETEDAGTVVDYRCVSCRNCEKCKDGDLNEMTSLRQEVEQSLIESNVFHNPANNTLEAGLPFMEDPVEHLKPNRHIAERVFESQMKRIQNNPSMKESVLKAHAKLEDKGYVIAEDDLPPDLRARMDSTPGPGVHLPWSVVHKESSVSTKDRIVFNGSSTTPNGKSLNNILAKGDNTLASILDILIRFRCAPFALTGDIRMAYNGLKLLPEFFKFQRYLWKRDLDPNNPILVYLILTIIYGLKSSGQQTICGLRLLARIVIQQFPEHLQGAKPVQKNAYMDDLMIPAKTREAMRAIAASVAFTLSLGSLEVKAFTFAGEPPTEEVSADGIHVGAVGYQWASEADLLKLDTNPFYPSKLRKRKDMVPPTAGAEAILRVCFTRRSILGAVMSVFDPMGLVTPMTARFKLDLHDLIPLQLGWDDPIPEQFFPMWVEHLTTMEKLNDISFPRGVVPRDAISDKMDLIVSCDASQKIAVATIHIKVTYPDGRCTVRLLLAKSKLVKGVSIPRAELKAAVMAAAMSHVVKKSLGDQVERTIFVTDSTIVLYWITQDYRPLHVSVRNSVIQIRRFSLPEQWFHIDGIRNIADLGTRTASIDEIMPGSPWQEGPDWMSAPFNEMNLKTCADITLSPEEKKDAVKEMKAPDISGMFFADMVSKLAERYAFSKYLLDPCSRPWPRVVRVMAVVIRAVGILTKKVPRTDENWKLRLSYEEIKQAENYYFRLATLEVRHFSKEKDWKDDSVLSGDILKHTGRILDNTEITNMSATMLDLPPLKFVAPIVDRFSPIAYSIMVYCHRTSSRHRNNVCTLRDSLGIAHIIRGRDLANEVRNACAFCRLHKRRLLEVEMGQLHPSRLVIAPAFYNCQVDLMGPYMAAVEQNTRGAIPRKVWGCVFKCPATGAVAVHAMDASDSEAVIMAYTRFSSIRGHPYKLYIDEGSQMMKACKDMVISMANILDSIAAKLHVGVEYQTCRVGAHNEHGLVERSIQEVKKLFDVVFKGLKLDVLHFETAFMWIANELNNLPICLGSRYRDLSHQDLITPNRLLLGRNNERAATGPTTRAKCTKLIQQNDEIFKAWWMAWRDERLITYIPQKKWKTTTYQPKPGDIVVFPKDDKEQKIGHPIWRTGRIRTLETSEADLLNRGVIIEYRNAGEKKLRPTRRTIREIAILHEEGLLEMTEMMNKAYRDAHSLYLRQIGYGEMM